MLRYQRWFCFIYVMNLVFVLAVPVKSLCFIEYCSASLIVLIVWILLVLGSGIEM
jgi:hypothetical protein